MLNGWRWLACSDSGSILKFTAHSAKPMAVSSQKILCQPRLTNSQPPMIGAMAGARPKKMVIWLITFCAWVGGNMSRTIARETTTPAPHDRPCMARKTISWVTFCASAQPRLAKVKAIRPHKITGRRPKLSASAPWNKFIKAKPNKYADSVCCMCTGDAFSELAMPENAGR